MIEEVDIIRSRLREGTKETKEQEIPDIIEMLMVLGMMIVSTLYVIL